MSEVALNDAQIDAVFEQMGRVGVTTGINTLLMFRRSLGSITAIIRSWAKT